MGQILESVMKVAVIHGLGKLDIVVRLSVIP